MGRPIYATFAAAAAIICICRASVVPSPSDARDLIDWATRTGKTSVLQTTVVNMLNLGHSALPIRERAFHALQETHLISVPRDIGVLNQSFIVIVRISD